MDTRSLEALKALEAAQPSNKFGTRLHDLPTQALEEEASMGVKVIGNQFKDAFCLLIYCTCTGLWEEVLPLPECCFA